MFSSCDIRKATINDVESLLILEDECFVAPWKKENLLYELNENPVSQVNVVCDGNKVVGFLDYWITFDSATICQIGVDKNYRNLKIASLLMQDMLDDCFAKRVQTITLEVRAKNLVAQKLYEKFGFVKTLVKKQYYTNGEDAVYMMRKVEL